MSNKFLVKIDRDTIKYDAGVYQLPSGPEERTRKIEQIWSPTQNEWITTSYQESINQPIQTLYSFPGNKYGYLPTLVRCNSCDKQFLHTELETFEDFYELCERVCPFCKQIECCELEFETLKDVENDSARID